jgi:hypothetical protein
MLSRYVQGFAGPAKQSIIRRENIDAPSTLEIERILPGGGGGPVSEERIEVGIE